jgi:exportin-7
VTTPLLKFFEELVNNKNARIVFDNISPNGIILFKEASRVLLAYGNRLLASPMPPPQDLYPARYKGMAIALRVLTNALDGNYVNFGVFTLYGDKVGHLVSGGFSAHLFDVLLELQALDDALDTAMKLILSVPKDDLLTYPKLSTAFFAFLYIVIRNHIGNVAALPPVLFNEIVMSLLEGVDNLCESVCASC